MDAPHVNKTLQKARQFMAQRKFEPALQLYAGLIRQCPQGGGEYGRAAADAGDFALALRVWEKFRAQFPRDVSLPMRLAAEYQTIGLHAKARELLAAAATLEPRDLRVLLELASLSVKVSGLAEARNVVNRCLEVDAQHPRALYLSALLDRREGKLAEAEQQLRDLIRSGPRHPEILYSCQAELAQILDRTERFEEAMTVLGQAKTLARQNFHLAAERTAFYERHKAAVRKVIGLPANILETWKQSFPAKARNVLPPVAFLSGCARSGTTLLEKILDAHPGVAAFDESPAFKAIQPQVESVPPQGLNLLRQRYVTNLTLPSLPGGDCVLLDKNPSRTLWLPAFLRLFPELRVIIALRDPRDVMVSLYFQNHARTNYLTLEELAEHYRGVMDVWLAVRQWEGLTWTETRYEDVVAGLPAEGARVTTFLGLDWREEQLRFHEANREKPVMSTNYAAVSQPLYSRAVGRWRVYAPQLAPVLPALEPYCKTFGYA